MRLFINQTIQHPILKAVLASAVIFGVNSAMATVESVDEQTTCTVFSQGVLSSQGVCNITGGMGGGISYVIRQYTVTGSFGTIDTINNITEDNQEEVSINGKPATTQYREATGAHAVMSPDAATAKMDNDEAVLQCIAATDGSIELCTPTLFEA